MIRVSTYSQCFLPCLLLALAGAQLARAASCTTQAQMTATQRNALVNSARSLAAQIQGGNVQALRQNTLPAVAANFSGIANSVNHLKPLVAPATITVDDLYLLNAPGGKTDTPSQVSFYCGSPVVVFNFNSLPPGNYALAILHATGVPHPQQISLILSRSTTSQASQWLLAGIFDKPMMEAGHDGLWYWTTARKYAHAKKDWDAWLYYRVASNLLNPLDFLSSPHLQKLHQEASQIRPTTFPSAQPMTLTVHGNTYKVTAIGTTTAFGTLDLNVHYVPNTAEAAQLQNPSDARKQVTDIMSALVELHPGLRSAFHGIWVHAEEGRTSPFALDLPMSQIAMAPKPQAAESVPAAQ